MRFWIAWPTNNDTTRSFTNPVTSDLNTSGGGDDLYDDVLTSNVKNEDSVKRDPSGAASAGGLTPSTSTGSLPGVGGLGITPKKFQVSLSLNGLFLFKVCLKSILQLLSLQHHGSKTAVDRTMITLFFDDQ